MMAQAFVKSLYMCTVKYIIISFSPTMREDRYFIAGRAIAVSLVHNGPPAGFLSLTPTPTRSASNNKATWGVSGQCWLPEAPVEVGRQESACRWHPGVPSDASSPFERYICILFFASPIKKTETHEDCLVFRVFCGPFLLKCLVCYAMPTLHMNWQSVLGCDSWQVTLYPEKYEFDILASLL